MSTTLCTYVYFRPLSWVGMIELLRDKSTKRIMDEPAGLKLTTKTNRKTCRKEHYAKAVKILMESSWNPHGSGTLWPIVAPSPLCLRVQLQAATVHVLPWAAGALAALAAAPRSSSSSNRCNAPGEWVHAVHADLICWYLLKKGNHRENDRDENIGDVIGMEWMRHKRYCL